MKITVKNISIAETEFNNRNNISGTGIKFMWAWLFLGRNNSVGTKQKNQIKTFYVRPSPSLSVHVKDANFLSHKQISFHRNIKIVVKAGKFEPFGQLLLSGITWPGAKLYLISQDDTP